VRRDFFLPNLVCKALRIHISPIGIIQVNYFTTKLALIGNKEFVDLLILSRVLAEELLDTKQDEFLGKNLRSCCCFSTKKFLLEFNMNRCPKIFL
jgi:hypothetical protein